MLGHWRLHEEYQSYLLEKISQFYTADKDNVLQYEKAYQNSTSLILIH
jgi:hypothetical protein